MIKTDKDELLIGLIGDTHIPSRAPEIPKNIISWLLNKAKSEEEQAIKPIFSTVAISQDLFYWIKDMINLGKWKNLEEVINYSLRVAKSKMTVSILILKGVILLKVLFKYVINNLKFGVLALRDLQKSL